MNSSSILNDFVGSAKPSEVFYDDLHREVYNILGMPIDAADISAVLQKIRKAASSNRPLLLSTPNINFSISALADTEFRETLLSSDLCVADGMPLVWIARMLGLPIKSRAAGADIFDSLKAPSPSDPLKIFFFGGTDDVANAASIEISRSGSSVVCVGWLCPGFGDLDDLSQPWIIDTINASHADFLVVALGARKGQLWLHRNREQLKIPVRSHLGAVINYQAGKVERAPRLVRKLGLEWLWRIKEEPHLWRRYWRDGKVLIRVILARVLPLWASGRISRLRANGCHYSVTVRSQDEHRITLEIPCWATSNEVPSAVRQFREAVASGRHLALDFSQTEVVDARFLGLLLMVRKALRERKRTLELRGLSRALKGQFRLQCVDYLLGSQ